jgi:hypothetical protein
MLLEVSDSAQYTMTERKLVNLISELIPSWLNVEALCQMRRENGGVSTFQSGLSDNMSSPE